MPPNRRGVRGVRRRTILAAVCTGVAGCSWSDETVDPEGSDAEPVTPVPLPPVEDTGRPDDGDGRDGGDDSEDDPVDPSGETVPAEAYDGLDPEGRDPRETETIELEATTGVSVVSGDAGRLVPVEGLALDRARPAALVFAAPPTGTRLDLGALSALEVVAGTADDVTDARAFVESTAFERDRLVVLTLGVAGAPSRQRVVAGGRTVAGRLYLEADLQVGGGPELSVLTSLVRVRTTDVRGLLVLYRRGFRRPAPADGTADAGDGTDDDGNDTADAGGATALGDDDTAVDGIEAAVDAAYADRWTIDG